jgi:hypothetical protein
MATRAQAIHVHGLNLNLLGTANRRLRSDIASRIDQTIGLLRRAGRGRHPVNHGGQLIDWIQSAPGGVHRDHQSA